MSGHDFEFIPSSEFADAQRERVAALEAENTRLRAALEVAEAELARIVVGIWVAPNSVRSMLHWVRTIHDGLHAALKGQG